MSTTSIPNASPTVRVAVDELISRYTVNRNIDRLVRNDAMLASACQSMLDDLPVVEYVEGSGHLYKFNDLIWYRNKKNYSELYLLKCLYDGNKYSPQLAIDNPNSFGDPDFEKFGWSDQNEYLDSMIRTVQHTIDTEVQGNIDSHGVDPDYHRFGAVSTDENSADYYANKILLRDLRNISPNRSTVFYPYITGHFSDDVIADGTYRVWDNGLLELNIIFRVGNVDPRAAVQQMTCNNQQIQMKYSDDPTDIKYFDNSPYFLNSASGGIFKGSYGQTSRIGNIIQRNRNDYVNAYFADIEFPTITYGGVAIQGFVDTNYMIFSNENLCQKRTRLGQSVSKGMNSMVYCNKAKGSITALYLVMEIPNLAEQADTDCAIANGLASNSFSCQIIGRWK